MKLICKHLGPYYEIQKRFPCKAFANEFIGELWIEIDEKYETLIYMMFGDSVVRRD
jgi:hypothetical protein